MAFEIIKNTKEAQDEYGHLWGSDYIKINKDEINALLKGKQLAYENGEYVIFISTKKPK